MAGRVGCVLPGRKTAEGVRYFIDHHTIQVALNMPVTRKAARQPKCNATQGTMAGARMAPTLAPELKMPVASERSLGGNHSATALMAAGKLPLSPRPRKKRATPKPATERTR